MNLLCGLVIGLWGNLDWELGFVGGFRFAWELGARWGKSGDLLGEVVLWGVLVGFWGIYLGLLWRG